MKSLFRYMVVVLFVSGLLKAENIDGLFLSLGGGISSANTELEQTYSSWPSDELKDDDGIGFSFKAGYGVNEDIALYFFINSSFVPGYYSDDSSLVNSVLGIGFNYYIDSSNTFYTIAGLGKGQFMKIIDTEDMVVYGKDDIYKGDGYMLGLGVNLLSNVHLELVYLGTKIDDTVDNKTLKLETDSTLLLLNYYWY